MVFLALCSDVKQLIQRTEKEVNIYRRQSRSINNFIVHLLSGLVANFLKKNQPERLFRISVTYKSLTLAPKYESR